MYGRTFLATSYSEVEFLLRSGVWVIWPYILLYTPLLSKKWQRMRILCQRMRILCQRMRILRQRMRILWQRIRILCQRMRFLRILCQAKNAKNTHSRQPRHKWVCVRVCVCILGLCVLGLCEISLVIQNKPLLTQKWLTHTQTHTHHTHHLCHISQDLIMP